MAIDLPASVTDAWQPCGTRTAETTVAVAEIAAEMTLYEPIDPLLPERAGSDIPVRSLFTVDLSLSPPLSAVGISPSSALSMAASTVKSQFVETLEDEDVVVEATRDSLEFEASNGAAGSWYVLDVAYPLEAAAEPTSLAAESHVAIWPTETSYGIAGGTLPLEMPDAGAPESDSSRSRSSPDLEDDRETIAEVVRTIDP